MDAIKQWSFLICLSSIISAIIEFLVPSGRLGKTMNFILGMFVIVVFIMPLSSKNYVFKNNFEDGFSNIIRNAKRYEKNSFLNDLNAQIVDVANKKIEPIVLRNLKNINVYPKKIKIFMDKDEKGDIVMIRCKIFVSSEDFALEGRIKSEVENRLNIKTEVVKYDK